MSRDATIKRFVRKQQTYDSRPTLILLLPVYSDLSAWHPTVAGAHQLLSFETRSHHAVCDITSDKEMTDYYSLNNVLKP